MKTLTNPKFEIIPNKEVFLQLSLNNQQKVELIYIIAVVAHNHNVRPMDSDEFNYLYDLEVPELEHYAQNFSQDLAFRSMMNTIRGGRSA